MKHATLLLAIVLLAGCQPGVKPPIQARVDPFPPVQINMASEDLRKHTAVGIPVVERDEHGMVFVTVPIRSASNLTLHVDYQVTFFNKNSGRIDTSAWRTTTLEANVPSEVVFNSGTPDATDFRINFRYSR